MKTTVIIFGIIIVGLLGVLLLVPGPKVPSVTPAVSPDGHVTVTMPLPYSSVTSPISIAGTVTGGGWFFEASFPIKILDGDGTVLGQSPAQAQGEWMSTGTVPFSASIPFTAPHYATGTIVFAKDNPSGLPQNEQEFSVPVTFAKTAAVASGAQGKVILGPTCPVERIPPDPACAPKPYPTTVAIFKGTMATGAPLKSVTTDASGAFNVSLDSGTYFFEPKSGSPFPRCSGTEVQVLTGQVAQVTLNCDTGIR